jgi:hypothetical protein
MRSLLSRPTLSSYILLLEAHCSKGERTHIMLATKEVPDIGSTEQSLISHADQFKRFRKTEHMRANSRLGGTHCKEQATHDYIFRFQISIHTLVCENMQVTFCLCIDYYLRRERGRKRIP